MSACHPAASPLSPSSPFMSLPQETRPVFISPSSLLSSRLELSLAALLVPSVLSRSAGRAWPPRDSLIER